MMKKLFLFTVAISISLSIRAQLNLLSGPMGHSHWNLSSTKINDCEYDLVFTVILDKGWHTFSIQKIKGAEKEVFATEIKFKPTAEYALAGTMSETKPTAEFDKTINKTVLLHYNKVVFTQRVKLNSPGKVKINGTYENQVCHDGACETPPHEKFSFDLSAPATCK